ncbi:MAG: hypothetical protein FWF01_03805 [Alphaproteobacteria bacterium]|nr:hypothetical protein [Alphaproteobacteria bacterium]
MIMFNNGLLSVTEDYDYDTFFIDAYGVFYAGNGSFYPGALGVMETLVKRGKTVAVVSNTSQLSENAMESYEKKGLEQGKHYDIFVSAGDVARSHLIENNLNYNFYMFFDSAEKGLLFDNTECRAVYDISRADMAFVPYPLFTKEIWTSTIAKCAAAFSWARTAIVSASCRPSHSKQT